MSNVSMTSSAVILDAVSPPTITLECTTAAKAVYASPGHVGT